MSSGIGGLLSGETVILRGVEEHPQGGIKAYVGQGLYAWIPDEINAEKVRRAWGSGCGHICIPKPPPNALFTDAESDLAADEWTNARKNTSKEQEAG
jgi:hypothetical protein